MAGGGSRGARLNGDGKGFNVVLSLLWQRAGHRDPGQRPVCRQRSAGRYLRGRRARGSHELFRVRNRRVTPIPSPKATMQVRIALLKKSLVTVCCFVSGDAMRTI